MRGRLWNAIHAEHESRLRFSLGSTRDFELQVGRVSVELLASGRFRSLPNLIGRR